MEPSLLRAVLSVLLLTGCAGDPLIGNWVAEGHPETDIHVHDGDDLWELLGDGHGYVCTVDGCQLCHVFFQIEAFDGGEYLFHGNPDGCMGGSFEDTPCKLVDGDSHLRCTFVDGSKGVFDRQAD